MGVYPSSVFCYKVPPARLIRPGDKKRETIPVLAVQAAYGQNKVIGKNIRKYLHMVTSSSSNEEEEWAITNENCYPPRSQWAHKRTRSIPKERFRKKEDYLTVHALAERCWHVPVTL